jgi:DNA-binding transcriptional MerR regulator
MESNVTKTNTIAPATAATATKATQENETFDIEQASKSCGLSAGVLRMWELRYGWPRPGRHPNGYRYFTRYQIQDLTRMAQLVKSGMLIGKLIQDGMPKWPNDGTNKPKIQHCLLETTRALPKPSTPVSNDIRDRLIEALKTHNHGKAWEMLLRATWEVHPSEQALTAWVPTLVALEEFRQAEREMPKSEQLLAYIRDHVRNALGRMAPVEKPLWIVPAKESDAAAAHVISLVMSLQGKAARPWLWEKVPPSRFVTVGSPVEAKQYPADRYDGHIAVIAGPDGKGLTALIAQAASASA